MNLDDIDPELLEGIESLDKQEYIEYIAYCKTYHKKKQIDLDLDLETLNRKELENRPSEHITPDNIYDIWKNELNIRLIRIPIKHKNGWLFSLGKFRCDNLQIQKNARVRMFIGITPECLSDTSLNDDQKKDIIKNFDSYFYNNKPFWDYVKLNNKIEFEFIDFDDCYIQTLDKFLQWCDTHSPLEIVKLHYEF